MTRFRVTQRCMVDDLGLDVTHCSRDAQDLSSLHTAIRTFYHKRSAQPGSGENMLNVTPYGHVKTLHIGRARALTIHDAEENVCWLLAYNETHAKGERRDAFRVFEKLSSRDELLPTPDDYLKLRTLSSESLIDELSRLGRALYDEAVKNPGKDAGQTLSLTTGTEAAVSVVVDMIVEQDGQAQETFVSFTIPNDKRFDSNLALDVIANIIPDDIPVEDVDFADKYPGRNLRRNEIAFTWVTYSSI